MYISYSPLHTYYSFYNEIYTVFASSKYVSKLISLSKSKFQFCLEIMSLSQMQTPILLIQTIANKLYVWT